jgi:glycosyltransferase involved in cell wall biosynthesis
MISLILPTLGTREKELTRLFDSLEKQDTQDFEVIIVSQDNHAKVDELLKNIKFKYIHIPINRRGLSLARNAGIPYAKGDIITFSDDDCWYPENAFTTVLRTFRQYNCDVACFQIYDPNTEQYYKNYPNQYEENVSFRNLFRKSSIEIFINTKHIDKHSLRFDENFGLGAKYPSGEENIFLFDLKRQNAKISHFPTTVVFHAKPSASSRLNRSAFIGKGPLFKRLYNTPIAIVILLLFFIKKFKYLEQPFSLFIQSMKEIFKYKKQ